MAAKSEGGVIRHSFKQDEMWANAHLWYPRSSANRKCDEKWAYMFNVYKNQQSESDGSKNASNDMAYIYEACDKISDVCHQ